MRSGGERGSTFSSTDAGASWQYAAADGAHRLLAVSCAGPSFCAATDNASRALVTTDPGASSHWRAVEIDRGRWLPAISCPTRRLCVAVDRHGAVVVSTHPTGGAGSWHRTQLVHGSLAAISCASERVCVAVAPPNHVLVSTRPTRGRHAWESLRLFSHSLDFGSALQSVSCASTRLCMASVASLGGDVDVWGASRPAARRSWRHVAALDSLSHDGDIAGYVGCGSQPLCVEADGSVQFGATDAFDSGDPPHSWRAVSYPATAGFEGHPTSVSCAPRGPCVIVSSDGYELTGAR